MRFNRRDFIAAGAAATAGLSFGAQGQDQAAPPPAFSFEDVKAKAADLAKQAYQDVKPSLPQVLRDLDYDHFRMINFKPDHALWRDGGLFQVQLFHRGFVYDRRVAINAVENGRVNEIVYSPDLFDFRSNSFKPDFDETVGFAGLRLHFPLNRGDYFDEFAVFQGASYFRLIGRGQTYGLSARGLAIDTAGPQGEEFPWFREFWVERPPPTALSINLYALLDSKSTTGAYKFVLTPDTRTVVHVDLVLYPRADIRKTGIAPLTSMYLHGKPDNRPFADLRPEVHDSDGLMLYTGAAEWLWRPLVNPRGLQITSLVDTTPKGFGLLQRERDFRAYEDLESDYQLRPSAWIEPEGDWAGGAVELVEIPSEQEINDNIVSYWVPKTPIKAGQAVAFSYRITMTLQEAIWSPAGYTSATRVAPLTPVEESAVQHRTPRRFWVDFSGGNLGSIGPLLPVDAIFTTSTGKLQDISAIKVEGGPWRAVFTFVPDGSNDADLRGFLGLRGAPLTETWTYHWAGA
jgi:glucans biosynthesis protein